MENKCKGWLQADIPTHSAEQQLHFIEAFRSVYKNNTKFVVPLGKKSKTRLNEISSYVRSNLVTDRYNQTNFKTCVACAIAFSECDFSNHLLFDALEYSLWTGDLITDLQYTRLFFRCHLANTHLVKMVQIHLSMKVFHFISI